MCSAPSRRRSFVAMPSRSARNPAASAKRRGCGHAAVACARATMSARGTSGSLFASVTAFVAVKKSVSVPSVPADTASVPFTPPVSWSANLLSRSIVESVVPGARTSGSAVCAATAVRATPTPMRAPFVARSVSVTVRRGTSGVAADISRSSVPPRQSSVFRRAGRGPNVSAPFASRTMPSPCRRTDTPASPCATRSRKCPFRATCPRPRRPHAARSS